MSISKEKEILNNMKIQKTFDDEEQYYRILPKIKCEICGKEFEQITTTHLRKHNTTISKYREQFPYAFLVSEGMSEKQSGENNGMYGKCHTKESKQKMRGSRPNSSDEKNHFYGEHHTKESKQKMSNNHADISGENNPMYGVSLPAWNKGKTKETDDRVKKTGEKVSKTLKIFFATEKGQKWLDEHNRGENHPMYGMTDEKNPMYGNHMFARGNNPNWQGGLSFLPYCIKFDYNLKERVRDFFNRCCYVCGKNEIDNGCKLDVHHVNYDKMVCCNDVKPLFVPLCKSCHTKTLKDRDYWEEFFTVSLEYLTDGECFLPKSNSTKDFPKNNKKSIRPNNPFSISNFNAPFSK